MYSLYIEKKPADKKRKSESKQKLKVICAHAYLLSAKCVHVVAIFLISSQNWVLFFKFTVDVATAVLQYKAIE